MLLLLYLVLAGGATCADSSYTTHELWDRVLEQQPELRKLENSREQAAQQLRKAKAERSPEIGFEGTGSYIGNPADPIMVDLAGPEPVEVFAGQDSVHYQFNLSLTQPIFTWGKINKSIELQQVRIAAAELEYDARTKELRSTFLILLDSLWYTLQIEPILAKQLSAVERLLEIAEDNYEQGLVLQDEVHSARMRVLETELANARAATNRQELLFELQKLTGNFDLSAQDISHTPSTAVLLSADPEGFRAREDEMLSENNTRLQLLSHGKAARDLSADIAASSVYWKPDLALNIELGYSGPRFPLIENDWDQEDDYTFNVTVAFSTTVWDGGKKLADIAAAKLVSEQADLDITAARQQLRYSFRQTVRSLEVLQNQADYYQQSIQVNHEIVSRKERQYESGSAGQWDLIAAKSDLYQNEIDYYRTLAELCQAYHTLISMMQG
ncbi:MAG: TolC family protein [Spirochaetota bacterium]